MMRFSFTLMAVAFTGFPFAQATPNPKRFARRAIKVACDIPDSISKLKVVPSQISDTLSMYTVQERVSRKQLRQGAEPYIAGVVVVDETIGTPKIVCSCEVASADCPDNHYCSFSEMYGMGQCRAYKQKGEPCGGFTIPGNEMICDPSLECIVPPTFGGVIIADAPGTCQETCESDKDCDSASWCRTTGFELNDPKVCVPYQAIGESCGGFTMPQFLTRCSPDAVCYDSEPLIADEPGICKQSCDSSLDCASFGGTACSDGVCLPLCDDEGNCPIQSLGFSNESNFWCRAPDIPGSGDTTVCAQYKGYGESCGGFTPDFLESRCGPLFDCVYPKCDPKIEPCIADIPGKCEFKEDEEIIFV